MCMLNILLTVTACSASHSCCEQNLLRSKFSAFWGLWEKSSDGNLCLRWLKFSLKQILCVYLTYPSSSLLTWAQKPIMCSHSSCLFVGWVALSVRQTTDQTFYISMHILCCKPSDTTSSSSCHSCTFGLTDPYRCTQILYSRCLKFITVARNNPSIHLSCFLYTCFILTSFLLFTVIILYNLTFLLLL